jgi:protein-disulfide isomerase
MGRPLAPDAHLGVGGARIGSTDAALSLIEFADFECPFWAVSAEYLKEIRERFPGALVLTYRHALGPTHRNAREAALAAECAAEQGAFEEYYYELFANYSRLARRNWTELAKKSGIANLTAFDDCVRSEKFSERIEMDMAAASRVGVNGTPTWVVGDSVYGGALPLAQLEAWVRRAVAPLADTLARKSAPGAR